MLQPTEVVMKRVLEIIKIKKVLTAITYDPKKWKRYKTWLVAYEGGIIKTLDGKILPQEYNTKGYLRVNVDGKRWLSHRFIAMVWLGASELQIDHLNGVKDCNDVSNFEYVTGYENQRRKKKGIVKRPKYKPDGVPF